MQDFLKDRPVVTPEEAKLASRPPPIVTGADSPFARLTRDPSAPAPAPRPAATPAKPPAGAPATAEHTTKVQPVMENGRVARIVVTCSCGKVTEIACQY